MMKGKRGFTLLELMIVVTIVGILAAVAIPAYNDYVTRARRSDAFTALETVRAAQEMFRAENGVYTGGALPGCSAGMAGSNYNITWVAAAGPPPTFTVTAQPQNSQAGDYTFTVNQNGTKTYDGTVANSWEEVPRHHP